MANIPISQRGYNRGQFRTLTDISFRELATQESNTEEDINQQINSFFKQYDKLFLNISVDGDNSHKTLIQRSSEYVGEGIFEAKDSKIESLENEILRLQEQILNSSLSETGREHPFIKNGSFIRTKDSEGRPAISVYFMEEGKKRLIKTYQLFLILKQGQGVSDKTDDDVIITLPQTIFKDIPTGPNIEEENFGETQTVEDNTTQLSVNTFTIEKGKLTDRTNYNDSDVDTIENIRYNLVITPSDFIAFGASSNTNSIAIKKEKNITISIEDFKGDLSGTYKDEFGGSFYTPGGKIHIEKIRLINKDTGNIDQEVIVNSTTSPKIQVFNISNIKNNYLIDIDYTMTPSVTNNTTSTTTQPRTPSRTNNTTTRPRTPSSTNVG